MFRRARHASRWRLRNDAAFAFCTRPYAARVCDRHGVGTRGDRGRRVALQGAEKRVRPREQRDANSRGRVDRLDADWAATANAGFVPADILRYDGPPALFGCSGGRPTGADDSLACTKLSGGSDGVAVRYVGDSVSTWASASGQATDCLGQAVAGSIATLGGEGVLVVNRYFANVSTSSGEPELYCEGNGNAGSAQPLVEGVERVRIKYWRAGAPDAMDASAVQADQWPAIVAVDLCVLVRGAPEGRRSRYVDCDGVSTLGADLRPRQAFSWRVALRNQAEISL
jgi:type IV pilus assembly protein PilW